eukprot:1276517-Rhodomonas_salina.1
MSAGPCSCVALRMVRPSRVCSQRRCEIKRKRSVRACDFEINHELLHAAYKTARCLSLTCAISVKLVADGARLMMRQSLRPTVLPHRHGSRGGAPGPGLLSLTHMLLFMLNAARSHDGDADSACDAAASRLC